MVQSRKRKTKREGPSHQRRWVWGRRAVLEVLTAGRWPLEALHLSETLGEYERATVAALAGDATVVIEPAERLTQLCHTGEHQGFLARMGPYRYASLNDLLGFSGTSAALLLVLDRIQDPFNFGAIVRSAEVLGASGLVIGRAGQAEVNSQVARSSAGAVNRIGIARADDLAEVCDRLRAGGISLLALTEKSERALHAADLKRPLAWVVGNEGQGIAEEVLARCDDRLAIPQRGGIGSLNVAAATAVALYEAMLQRDAGRESKA